MGIKSNSLKNAAEKSWNVAKYQDKGVCRCYTNNHLPTSNSYYTYNSQKIYSSVRVKACSGL